MKECFSVVIIYVYIIVIFVFSPFYQCHCLNRENCANCPIKVVQSKFNASVWNWTHKVCVTAHYQYQRAYDDLCQIYLLIYHKTIRYSIGLFKSQFDSLISIYKHGYMRNMQCVPLQTKMTIHWFVFVYKVKNVGCSNMKPREVTGEIMANNIPNSSQRLHVRHALLL